MLMFVSGALQLNLDTAVFREAILGYIFFFG